LGNVIGGMVVGSCQKSFVKIKKLKKGKIDRRDVP
jgi:hypothetical protein